MTSQLPIHRFDWAIMNRARSRDEASGTWIRAALATAQWPFGEPLEVGTPYRPHPVTHQLPVLQLTLKNSLARSLRPFAASSLLDGRRKNRGNSYFLNGLLLHDLRRCPL